MFPILHVGNVNSYGQTERLHFADMATAVLLSQALSVHCQYSIKK